MAKKKQTTIVRTTTTTVRTTIEEGAQDVQQAATLLAMSNQPDLLNRDAPAEPVFLEQPYHQDVSVASLPAASASATDEPLPGDLFWKLQQNEPDHYIIRGNDDDTAKPGSGEEPPIVFAKEVFAPGWQHIYMFPDANFEKTYERRLLMMNITFQIKECFQFIWRHKEKAWAKKTLEALNKFINFEQCMKKIGESRMGEQKELYTITMEMFKHHYNIDKEEDLDEDSEKKKGAKKKMTKDNN